MDSLDMEIAAGEQATLLLNNELLKKSLEDIEMAAINNCLNATDKDKRDEAWHQAKAVRLLRTKLETLASSGQFAKAKKARLPK